MYHRLQYISQGSTPEELLHNIQQALDAGCMWVQLRMKKASEAEVLATAREAKKICAAYSAVFIVNDHPRIAKAVDADGVHLGLQDMTVADARTIIGEEKIIGGTANTFEDVVQRFREGCQYAGVGPFRFTTTKENLSPVLGAAGYQQILDQMDQQGIRLPVYAIGGILPEDLEAIMSTGVHGIAVSGVITHHSNKKQLVHQLNALLYATAHHSR